MSTDDTAFFLQDEFVRRACADAALPEDVAARLLALAAQVRADPALRAAAEQRRAALYRADPPPLQEVRDWPDQATAAAPEASLLYVLVAFAGLPEMRDFYRAHAIPEDVYRHTLSDVLRWMEQYRERTGRPGHWGLSARYLPWLRHHFKGEIFHLGRLQFEPGRANTGAHFFRHRSTGRVVALAEAGLTFRADGQLQGAGGAANLDGGWQSTFELTETRAAGYPISPLGHAIPRPSALPLDEWQPVLSPGDRVLNIHMPAGSPMDFDACGASFAAALDFFPRHLPEHRFVAFACSSWLLDPQLDGPLPSGSNIVRFQRQVYLLPSPSNGRSTLERVFGTADVDPRTAPRDTTLRRAVLELIERGGHPRSARCAIFPEDLRRGAWGRAVYRSQLDAREM